MPALNFKDRPNRGRRQIDAYCGRARVGYVDERSSDQLPWRWTLNFPSEAQHGLPTGASETIEEAQTALTKSFTQWCEAAGLVKEK